MRKSFTRRALVSIVVWVATLSMWTAIVSLFSDTGMEEEIRHIVAAINALADRKLWAAQLLALAVVACLLQLIRGRKYSGAHVRETHQLFMAEAVASCIGFVIFFGIIAIAGAAALFLKDPLLPDLSVMGSIAMMLISLAIAHAVWLKIN